MNEELLSKLLQFVEEASPFVWAAVRRQAIIDLYTVGFWVAVLGVTCWQMAEAGRAKWKSYHDTENLAFGMNVSSDDILAFLFGAAAGTSGFAALVLLTHLFDIVANPDYYAIRLLLNLVR